MPARDVDITYTITRGGQSLQEQTRWRAAEQEQRVDPPGTGVHFIMDFRQHRAWLVNDNSRSVMEMAAPRQGPLEPGSATQFTRRGETTIAGLACTDWATSGGGPETVLCLTADGVLLRVQAGGHTLVEASSVTYAPSDAALFQIPAQYAHVQPPK